ncbi:porin [Opitutus sp. ER46]|uniref:OprO/OprP family phosphate-selective porin n=1 Tax=Opitutus sp. ER46 TaxID=2161864 RepID=UPI000D40E1E4|nr:porin [Opitutus sp. ER46]PTX96392.1 porin [Opitutus sp. ER46]
MKHVFSLRSLLAALLAISSLAYAQPVDRAEVDALRAQVQRLEQQIQLLTRQLEAQAQAQARTAPAPAPAAVAAAVAPAPKAGATTSAAAAPSAAPKIAITDKGVTFTSADGANAIKLRGLVQFDSRLFLDDAPGVVNSTFVLRRARVITEGTFAKNYGYQFVTEFGGSSVSILDANISVALTPAAQLKFGKFKEPLGLELLQSDSWTFFNERSMATNLVPNRDLGVQLSGDVIGGKLNYMVGLFGGLADNASTTNTDYDEEKDLIGRVFASPFKDQADSPLKGLGFGVAASVGRQKTASGRTSAYRTDGQQTFFSYLAPVVADGQTWRVAPQFDYRRGAFGANGEYVLSVVNLRSAAGAPKAELRNKAWQLSAGYVLTGEDSSPNGVAPKSNFDWAAGTWGAFEVTGRYANLTIDDAAFPAFAAPGASAQEADAFAVGLSWYLSKVVRFTFDYYQTNFGFHALAPAVPTTAILRQDEKAFITRFQISF